MVLDDTHLHEHTNFGQNFFGFFLLPLEVKLFSLSKLLEVTARISISYFVKNDVCYTLTLT